MRVYRLVSLVIIGSLLGGCATMGGGDRQWANCGKGALAAGATAGVLTKVFGGSNTVVALSTVAGAAIGCTMGHYLTEKDKQEIASAEKEALESGTATQTAQTTWKSENGEERSYSVKTEPVQLEAKAGTECKKATGTLTDADGETEGTSEQVYCKSLSGEWETAGAVL